MTKIATLSGISWLHHFTDSRNLPSILARGGLYSMQRLKEIGVEDVVAGGNEWSQTADVNSGMDRYVHLCFRSNHPMEYRAKERGQIVKTSWLYVDAERVFDMKGVKFCPGVANKSGMEVLSLKEAESIIDYEVLYGRLDLRDPSVQARMSAAERYEILVPDFVPIKYFERFFPNG